MPAFQKTEKKGYGPTEILDVLISRMYVPVCSCISIDSSPLNLEETLPRETVIRSAEVVVETGGKLSHYSVARKKSAMSENEEKINDQVPRGYGMKRLLKELVITMT